MSNWFVADDALLELCLQHMLHYISMQQLKLLIYYKKPVYNM